MRKRLFSILLALCMVLCLVPTTAFAEGKTEETPVCTCETACAEETMNAECPVCGADGALAENCGKYAAEESGQTGAPDNAPAITAADVQALINALPESETISEDNAVDVEAQLEAIDEAKVQLSDEDFAVLDFTRYDAAVAVLMALSGEPGATFVPQAASSHTHCICGGENTVGDHTAHQAADYQPWNGSDAISYTDGKVYVYLTDNATINTNLVVDGTTLYLCLNGKEYASNGTNKIQVKNSGRLVLCDCKGTGVIKGATSGWGGMGIYLYTGTVDIFGGKLTGGKVTGKGGGGAIALEDSSSTLNIYGGEMSGNHGNNHGGAIYTKTGGTINMYGGLISQNETSNWGGGIDLRKGVFNMYGGCISQNKATWGGGMSIDSSTFNMYGGSIEYNSSTAPNDGSALAAYQSGNLRITEDSVMNANAGVVRGSGYGVYSFGTIQTDDANYPATKFYSGLYHVGGIAKGGMYYGSYVAAGGHIGGCEVRYTLEDSNLASYQYARQLMEPGNTPTRPDDPTKTGYLFDGWYVGENAFDFSVPVTENVRVVAKWSECDHTGSTAQPTCTDSAVCTICRGTIPEKGHALTWQSENGEYWQKCSNCDFETEKKPIPVLTLNAPDKVCRTQNCIFTFNLPDGCTNPEFVYEFTHTGSDAPAIVDNGVCNGTVEADWYDKTEANFKLTVYATTADGFLISTSKNIEIVDEHTYEWQSENDEYWQKCKLCGNETTKKPIPEIAISGADRVCRTQDYTFGFTLSAGCKFITTGYEFEKIGGDLSATLENGNYTIELGSSGYPAEENSFKVMVHAKTADGFAIKAEKTVTIQNDHTGGKATCTTKAVCEVCKAEYGEKLPHDFTAETVDAKYLKSAATCTEKAIYYKSCVVCGLSSEGTADEATFFSGNALDHNWGAWTSNEDGTHTRTCTVDGCSAGTQTENCIDANKDHKCDYCGKKLTDHTGGKATCKDKAKCEVCGAEYGELDPKNHTDLKHTPAKAATKTTEGNIEHWYCDGCGKYYSDKDGTKEIKKADTITTKLKDDSKSPQTGDSSNFALWLALLFVSGGAAIGTTVVSRKKKYNR